MKHKRARLGLSVCAATGIPVNQLNAAQREAMDVMIKAQDELPPRPIRPPGPVTQAYLDELVAYKARLISATAAHEGLD